MVFQESAGEEKEKFNCGSGRGGWQRGRYIRKKEVGSEVNEDRMYSSEALPPKGRK